MKTCNTPIFNKKIKAAIRKIQRNKIKAPSDGYMISLFDSYTRRGKWQIDYIYDTRINFKPYIAAHFFKTHSQEANCADLVKYQVI
jgi:hypothetical protein